MLRIGGVSLFSKLPGMVEFLELLTFLGIGRIVSISGISHIS